MIVVIESILLVLRLDSDNVATIRTYYFVYTAAGLIIYRPLAGSDACAKKGEKDISVKENVAHEVPPSRIKMTENEAYATLPSRFYRQKSVKHNDCKS